MTGYTPLRHNPQSSRRVADVKKKRPRVTLVLSVKKRMFLGLSQGYAPGNSTVNGIRPRAHLVVTCEVEQHQKHERSDDKRTECDGDYDVLALRALHITRIPL